MTEKPARTATITLDNRSMEVPVYDAVHGPSVIDVRTLYKELGVFTYDPGYTSTGSCESKITFIDGDEGELLYRGYSIDELAESSHYLEVCYLLIYGELPNATELETSAVPTSGGSTDTESFSRTKLPSTSICQRR